MKFYTDKQTINDLNITGKYNKNSIFSIYNKTITKGGEKVLEKMFANPLTNTADINNRAAKFRFFSESGIGFPFSREEFQQAEDYLINTGHKNFITSVFYNIRKKAMKLLANEKEFDIIQTGFNAAINFFARVDEFVCQLEKFPDSDYSAEKGQLSSLSGLKEIKGLVSRYSGGGKYSFLKFCRYDHFLRYKRAAEIISALKLIHELDVYTSVANYSKNRGFTMAKAISPATKGAEANTNFSINVEGVYHPGLKNATANNICINTEENLFFLTGANMAGKSTLMKSFSIAVYLAHMGFPVAAGKMGFTVMEGLYTSINVPDNLNMGYSHFYAEVMRVKMIAGEIAEGKRLVVLFDEMFKGTNVKDAFDATVCISECFNKNRRCAFIVSTHIMEAAISLQQKCFGVQYKFLPTKLNNGVPSYTYILQDGVSDDHFGMIIVNNEKIIELIKKSPTYESC